MTVNGDDIPDADMSAMLTAFDVWRDGKGPWASNTLVGRRVLRDLFLRATDGIALRVWYGQRREQDHYGPVRYLRALRSVLATRPKSQASVRCGGSGQLTLWEGQ